MLNKTNIILSAFVTFLAGIFGKFWFLFAALLILNLIDYITGWAKAYLTHTENSNKGFRGICKKTGCWVVIGVAFFCAISFREMGHILGIDLAFCELAGWFCLATFIINEIRSILENLVVIGVDVPSFLIKGLKVASEKINFKIDEPNS